MLDDHGQPDFRIHSERIARRDLDELIGLCKGLIADGMIVQAEAEFLQNWLEQHQLVSHQWPANQLYHRIRHMLVDHFLDKDEQQELFEVLQKITGEKNEERNGENFSTQFCFDDPPPAITFEGQIFCFTGKFIAGSRKQCESWVRERKGLVHLAPSRQTKYLVIGVGGSRDWLHSTHGTKIQEALELKQRGAAIAIVSEKHWFNFVGAET